MNDDLDRALDRLAGQPDDIAMAAVAAAAPGADVPQLARLTRLLAESGEILGAPAVGVVDIASSGGPGSLSTLLAPLYARALGVRVAKIAVPGRPAGGLDVLASLPGYDPDLGVASARRVYGECGYVHVAAGVVFCPLDARFFAWRQANGAQSIPNLAIASLLAKKVAAGVGRVVLDIRVGPHGNLGATVADARPNARRLIAVAAGLGIRAICVLSVSSGAAQPWIGRGEALVALAAVLDGTADGALGVHAQECLRMAALAADVADPPLDRDALAPAASRAHEAMLAAHGADSAVFRSRQGEIASTPRCEVAADRQGSLTIDLAGLRAVLVERQRSAQPVAGARFADPAGVKLELPHGGLVDRESVLARVRDEQDPMWLAKQIAKHLRVVEEPPDDAIPQLVEVIDG
jgi:pyrimidine-nucleoside phosphorylase